MAKNNAAYVSRVVINIEDEEEDLLESLLKTNVTLKHQDNNVAVVEASLNLDDFGKVRATGVARRNPIDKQNRHLGRVLATARAYEALAKKLTRRANGELTHFENMQKAKVNKSQEVKASKTKRVTKKVQSK